MSTKVDKRQCLQFINTGRRRMESNSVCNHTSDYKIGQPWRGSPTCYHEYDYRPTSDNTKSTYQLIKKYYNFQEAQEIKILLMKLSCWNTGYQITDIFENDYFFGVIDIVMDTTFENNYKYKYKLSDSNSRKWKNSSRNRKTHTCLFLLTRIFFGRQISCLIIWLVTHNSWSVIEQPLPWVPEVFLQMSMRQNWTHENLWPHMSAPLKVPIQSEAILRKARDRFWLRNLTQLWVRKPLGPRFICSTDRKKKCLQY